MKWLDSIWWKGLARLLVVREEPEHCQYLLVEKNQDKISVVARGAATWEELAGKYEKTPVLWWAWEGQVFARKLEADQLEQPVEAMLGVSVEEAGAFCVEMVPAAGGAWVALARREQLAEQVAARAEQGLQLVGVSLVAEEWLYALVALGNAGDSVLHLAGADRDLYMMHGELVESEAVRDQPVRTLRRSELAREWEVAEEDLDLYVAAVAFWVKPEGGENAPIYKVRKSFIRTALDQRLLRAAVAVLLVWGAFLATTRLRIVQEKTVLEQTYARNLPVLKSLQQLDQKIASRQELVHRLGTQTLVASRCSFYLDRIAADCPREIQLRQVIYLPGPDDLPRQIEENGKWTLLLAGECRESHPVAAFTSELEALDWVDELKVTRSAMNYQTGDYRFNFLIRAAHDR